MNSAPLIDIQTVSYTYGASPGKGRQAIQPALRAINLQVFAGEYVALLGHNGSGKSTLARHCNALLMPEKGRVLVGGLDTRDSAHQRTIREQVGMIFQYPDNQIIATIVKDDIAWALSVRGRPIDFIRKRVEEAMKAVGIERLSHQPPHKLSGGERQRLAIASVLALRPRCIIADEATSMLDPLSRREVVALLHQLNREHGLTVIHVTHLLEEIVSAHRVVVMAQGQIVREGSPAELFSNLDSFRDLGLSVPEPIELVTRLRAAGFSISQKALTIEAIAQELMD